MKGRSMALSALSVAALAAGADGLAAQDEFQWRQDMRPREVLEVKGIVGEIRVEAASGDRAEVVAHKRGRARDFDEVEIRVEEEGDGYTICAVYNVSRVRGDGCDWSDDGDGRRDRDRKRSLDVAVDFTVRLPAGVEFVGAMVSGDVVAEDLRSDVHANTVSGDIFVSTTGLATANTVSGSIEIEMGTDDWDRLDFRTVSGDITLWLPEGLATDVDFESLSGDIDSDFDVTTTGRRSRRWVGEELEGWIGRQGERTLTLNTVSGDVRLRRAR